jgi:small subunit ribosomal protein S6
MVDAFPSTINAIPVIGPPFFFSPLPLSFTPRRKTCFLLSPAPERAACSSPEEGAGVTRHYEVVFIFDSSLEETAINEHLTRFNALLGGAQPAVNHWGKRTLSYPIRRHQVGYYVVTQFDTEPTLLPEFERAIKLDDSVIRFLVVQLDAPLQALPAEAAVGASDEEDE